MTGAVAEPVTMETEVTEAGSQPVAVVVQEDSAGDSDDEEDRGESRLREQMSPDCPSPAE